MEERWGSPLDRAGEALAMHQTRLETDGLGRVAWRQVHPEVREAYIEQARVVLRTSGAVEAGDRLATMLHAFFRYGYGSPEHEDRCREALRKWNAIGGQSDA